MAWSRERKREWNASARGKAHTREYRLKQLGGWTSEKIEEALRLQNGRCWICSVVLVRELSTDQTLNPDHNHDTKKRRGLLCARCNRLEGILKAMGMRPEDWVSRLRLYLDTFDGPGNP